MRRAYRNRTAASLFIEPIATIIQKKIVSGVNFVEFYPVLIDGSTDVLNKEHEIVYIWVLEEGKPVNMFWG